MGINTGIAKALAGIGRGKNISRQVLGKNSPGGLFAPNNFGAVQTPMSKFNALARTGGGTAIGAFGAADLTEDFTESAKLQNSIFSNPEELGRKAARAKMSLEEIMDNARQEAERIGNIPQFYFIQIQSGYKDEMKRQNPNQIYDDEELIYDEDIEGGARPVSLVFAGGGEASSQHMMPDGTPMPGSNHQEYEAMMMQQRQMMAGGGTPFPDLTGDGQITQADILKGRGVYAEGDEVMDVNNLPEDIKQKVENIYRKLYLSNPDIERNRRRPNTASLTNEENELLDQYTKGALRRDIPLLSKYMDMIGMDDIVNDNTLLQALKISSIGVGMAGALPTSRIRGAMNPELGIGNDPMFDKVMEERKETYGYAVGGEAIGDELEGMEMTEEQAMVELEESRGEFEQLQMLADVVKKLLNEGMGEAEIVAYLKEQGLDDEDIETLFSFLQEISGQESSMEQAPQGIDQQLQGMM